MKQYILVNQGIEQVAKQEIKEKLNEDAIISKNVLEFTTKKEFKLQSARRILLSITKTKNLNNLELNLPKDIFTNETKFKIEVENVQGQENRLDIARNLAGKIFEQLKPINPNLDLKKPELLVVVFFNGKEYFIGIDKNVGELNSRSYRVFSHPSSFKGDLAYYFARKSKFQKGENFLSGFCKDGAISIEAAKFADQTIYAFDEVMPNVTATRKNSKIAKAEVKVQKYSLDDLDVKYDENFFDRVVLHITKKDEAKINEIYYQSDYILKKKGTLLIITGPNLELSISDKFKLLEEMEIVRGESVLKAWLLEKL